MMMWDEWDGIGIFSDTDDPVPFYNQGGNLFCSLHGESVSGNEFHAYYPYNSIRLQSDRKELYISNFIAGTGWNPRLDIPMVARYDGSTFAFKHTAGILHFSITGSQTLHSIKLKSNAGEPVFGPSRINLDEETPILRCDCDGSDYCSLWLDNTVLSKDEPLEVHRQAHGGHEQQPGDGKEPGGESHFPQEGYQGETGKTGDDGYAGLDPEAVDVVPAGVAEQAVVDYSLGLQLFAQLLHLLLHFDEGFICSFHFTASF